MAESSVLVTGGAGFIGSHLVDRLLGDGWRVAVVDDLSTGNRANLDPAADLYTVDIRDNNLPELLGEIAPQTVFHLAGQISVAVSAREPLLDARINVIGMLNLLEGLRKRSLPRFIFASTGGAIYGEPERLPTSESDPARPVSPYAAAKLACEGYLGTYRAAYGFDYSILRLGNIYGPRQDPHGEAGVIAIFARAMLADEPVKIHGDGEDERDYVYVTDTVDAFLAAAERGGPRAYNIGAGKGISVNYLERELRALIRPSHPTEHGPERPGDIHRSRLDSSLAREELAWSPKIGMEEGLKRTVNFFRKQAGAAGKHAPQTPPGDPLSRLT